MPQMDYKDIRQDNETITLCVQLHEMRDFIPSIPNKSSVIPDNVNGDYNIGFVLIAELNSVRFLCAHPFTIIRRTMSFCPLG